MIKKLFCAFLLMLFATSVVAQLGTSCDNPIPVDSNYVGSISKAGIYWFTAGTYDLPLNVHFKPVDPSTSRAPEVMIDLTCEEGVYEDRLVDSLIHMVEDFDITFPAEMRLETDGDEYDMFVDAMYREQMAKFGVTYNVPAYVRVQFFGPGEISFRPDTVFTSCLDNDKVVLGDTLAISANDSENVLLMPYTDWQNDSIQFVWLGSSSATVYMAAGNCDFAPSISDGYVWTAYKVQPNEPYKVSNKEIRDAVAQNEGGGIFYAKIISSIAGKMVVETIPMSETQGGAKLLEYGKSVSLKANDNSLYCFPKSWTSTQFIGTSEFITKAYFSNTSEFTAKDDDAAILSARTFSKVNGARELSLSTTEMSAITKNATDDYIYVRFQCGQPTTITPLDWDASFCADKSTIIVSGNEVSIASRSGNTVYRLLYDDWKGADLTVEWRANSTLPLYIADTCAHTLSSSAGAVIYYSNMKRPTNNKPTTVTIPASTIDSWVSRVDADGFLYVRMNPSATGRVTFISSRPAEEDPALPAPMDTTITDTICYGVTYEWNGQKYTTSGEYEQSFTATNGADSTVTLNLVVLPEVKPVLTDVTVEYGKTYEWNDKVYAETTTDTITLQDEHGCDYLAILKLTVLDKPASPCVLNSIELKVKDQLTLNLDSAFTVYRINYSEWAATGATLTWSGTEPLHTFVAETCEFYVAPYNKYVHAYVNVPAEGEVVLNKTKLADLAAYVDEDGYLYIRFLTEKEGVLEVK